MSSPNPGSVIHPDGRGRRDASGKPKEKNRRRTVSKDGPISKDGPVSAKRNSRRKNPCGSKKSAQWRARNRAERRAKYDREKAERLLRRKLQEFAATMQKAMRLEIGGVTKKGDSSVGSPRQSSETDIRRRRRAYARYYCRCLRRDRLPAHVPEWFHDMSLWREFAGLAFA